MRKREGKKVMALTGRWSDRRTEEERERGSGMQGKDRQRWARDGQEDAAPSLTVTRLSTRHTRENHTGYLFDDGA